MSTPDSAVHSLQTAASAAARGNAWAVHKFGGSSVADAECFMRVAAILESQPEKRLGVVLSACRGVTDALLRLVTLAEEQDPAYQAELQALSERHAEIAGQLLSREAAGLYMAAMH